APPLFVGQVPAPSGGLGPRRLQVSEGIGADPDVRPRRRDREGADPPDRVVVGHLRSGRIEVGEAPTTALSPDPRTLARHPPQARHRAEVLPQGGAPKRETRRRAWFWGYLPSDRSTGHRR